jgi:NADH-quinone oxidoreductase subunit J
VEAVLFFLFGTVTLGAAIAVVAVRNPFFSVVALILHLFSLGVLFLLLHAQFLAVAQVIVYAGAVMVLYLFVAAYVGGVDEPSTPQTPLMSLGPLFAIAVGVELILAMLGTGLSAIDSKGAEIGPAFGTPGQIGELLLTQFLIPFEAASYLLLVAAVAAVVLAQRRRGLDELTPQPIEDAR